MNTIYIHDATGWSLSTVLALQVLMSISCLTMTGRQISLQKCTVYLPVHEKHECMVCLLWMREEGKEKIDVVNVM